MPWPFTWNFLVMVFVTQDFLHTEATVKLSFLTRLSHCFFCFQILQFFFFVPWPCTMNFFLPPTLESVQGSGVGAAPHSLQDFPHHDDTLKSLLLTMLSHFLSL